jgi:hypothetical protein
MVVAELFFGRAIKGRTPLSDTEWAEFTVQTITPNFPDGFTVFDGEGQWRNPRTGHIARDPTKILLIATGPTLDLAQRLSAIGGSDHARRLRCVLGRFSRDKKASPKNPMPVPALVSTVSEMHPACGAFKIGRVHARRPRKDGFRYGFAVGR